MKRKPVTALRNKNIAIILMGIAGAFLFCIVRLILIPSNILIEERRVFDQLDATTHDIHSVLRFQTLYMGDTKICVLQNHLPLAGTMSGGSEMFPESLTTQFNYEDTLLNIGRKSLENKAQQAERAKLPSRVFDGRPGWSEEDCVSEVKKSLIYNATVSFALVANLEHLVYCFSDITYKVSREDVESLYDDFARILDESCWKYHVQDKLLDPLYVENTARRILIRQSQAPSPPGV